MSWFGWIKRKLAENRDNKALLRGCVLSRKENMHDECGQRQLRVGVYVMRLFVHLILWMYNLHHHADKERKGINSIKYFVCNVDAPKRKGRRDISGFENVNKNKNKQQRQP